MTCAGAGCWALLSPPASLLFPASPLSPSLLPGCVGPGGGCGGGSGGKPPPPLPIQEGIKGLEPPAPPPEADVPILFLVLLFKIGECPVFCLSGPFLA